MLRILALVCIMSYAFAVRSQNHLPFPDSGAVWQIDHISMGVFYPMDAIGVLGDTVINTNTYHKLIKLSDTASWDPFPINAFIGGIREEDSLWWFIKDGESNEYVLYDFSVEAGDTISFNNPWCDTDELIVTNIDSILQLGSYRKRIQLLNPIGGTEFWIEGIGSTYGIIYSGEAAWDEGNLLMCFHENDTLTYINPEYNDCNYSTVGLITLELGYGVSVYPNPSKGDVVIEFEKASECTGELLDATGRLVRSFEMDGNQRFHELTSLSHGVYMLVIHYLEGNTETKRIIVE